MEIQIPLRRATKYLIFAAVGLLSASVVGQFSSIVLGHGNLKGFVPFFDMDREANAPTLYSSVLLLICSVSLAIITVTKKKEHDRYALHWKSLSVIFLCLSLIEISLPCEALLASLLFTINVGGSMNSTWILPVLFLIVAYRNFLLDLPTDTRRLFILAGSAFWVGAVGMEIVDLRYAELYGFNNFTYAVMTSVEEFIEMMAIITFIHALASYIYSHMQGIQISIVDGNLSPEVSQLRRYSREEASFLVGQSKVEG